MIFCAKPELGQKSRTPVLSSASKDGYQGQSDWFHTSPATKRAATCPVSFNGLGRKGARLDSVRVLPFNP